MIEQCTSCGIPNCTLNPGSNCRLYVKIQPSTFKQNEKLTGLICPVCECDDVYCDCSLKEST